MKSILFFVVSLLCVSCKSNEFNHNNDSMVTNDNQISLDLASDSLFIKYDKVYFELMKDLLAHHGQVIDVEKSLKITADFKSGKYKSLQDYANAMENKGNKDLIKRVEIYFNAVQARNAIYLKYPQLKTLPKKNLELFLREHTKYEISTTEIIQSIKK